MIGFHKRIASTATFHAAFDSVRANRGCAPGWRGRSTARTTVCTSIASASVWWKSSAKGRGPWRKRCTSCEGSAKKGKGEGKTVVAAGFSKLRSGGESEGRLRDPHKRLRSLRNPRYWNLGARCAAAKGRRNEQRLRKSRSYQAENSRDFWQAVGSSAFRKEGLRRNFDRAHTANDHPSRKQCLQEGRIETHTAQHRLGAQIAPLSEAVPSGRKD